MIDFVYADTYLSYVLGDRHPTRPVRALNTLRLVQATGVPHRLVEPRQATDDELAIVHDPAYIEHIRAGYDYEWDGYRPQLHDVAALIAGGTLDAARRIITGETVRAFNPMGAKHHAMRDRSEGFCIYNDMAIAATVLADAGMRVLYIDWDAHHGNGVEFLLEHRTDVLTASIHNGEIYPGTGLFHRPKRAAYNWPLPDGSGGTELRAALTEVFEIGAAFQPDVVLLATGADGHERDPLGGLGYTVDDFTEAGQRVAMFADRFCSGRVLAGGAGGYRANDWTPRSWLAVVRALAGAEVPT